MYDLLPKIILFGDVGVGKKTLAHNFLFTLFNSDSNMTIGVDFCTKLVSVEGLKVKLEVWIFRNEERFRFLRTQYVRGARGGILMYDITNSLSLDHLPDWTQIIRENAGDIPIMLIGNKIDLKEFRAVSRDEGISIAKSRNVNAFIECSCKTGENVEKAFEELTSLMLHYEY